MTSAYQKLERVFAELHTLRSCISLMQWDSAVVLPEGAAALRAEQLAYLQNIVQKRLQSKTVARYLDQAETKITDLNDWQSANLREMRHLWRMATAVPARLQQQLNRQTVNTELIWRQARHENNYALFIDPMERLLELVRNKAECLAAQFKLSPYAGLMQEYDAGIELGTVEAVFSSLDQQLPSLLHRMTSQSTSKVETETNHSEMPVIYPISAQESACKEIAADLGFDFSRGRLDQSSHPFTEGVTGDIRITTFYNEHNPFVSVLSLLHEVGHGLYDQHLPHAWLNQPVGRDRGMIVHEGIALFMEMLIGRNAAFNEYLLTVLQKHLHSHRERLATLLNQQFRQPQLSPIRIEADMLSYIPHILLRYQLEHQLISGELNVKDIPEQWNSRFYHYFSFYPKNHQQGCLQDVHWSLGLFGYFPSYALGLLFAVALEKQTRAAIPDLDQHLRQGNFLPLLHYLKQAVFTHGAYYPQTQFIENICGESLSTDGFIEYVQQNFLTSQ